MPPVQALKVPPERLIEPPAAVITDAACSRYPSPARCRCRELIVIEPALLMVPLRPRIP